MLVLDAKIGSGINGEGIFDFGRILLKKALNSNLIKTASKAINSDIGQTAIRAIKRAADSEIGQEIKKKALSEVNKKPKEVSNKTLDKINVPESVKKAAKSKLGRQLQNKIITEIGENTQKLTNQLGISAPLGKRAANFTKSTFEKLGIAEPPKKRIKKRKTKTTRKTKGKGFVYPQELISQFTGGGIVIE